MNYFNDWCVVGPNKTDIVCSTDLDRLLQINEQSLSEIRKNSTTQALTIVGNNPVLCLSGGVDSQAAYKLWDHSVHPITPVIFKFSNNFNSHEVSDALNFCNTYAINPVVIELDVLRFLEFNAITYAKKFNISSPQFAVHCHFLDKVKELGYTGAVFGGNSFVISQSRSFFHITSAQLSDIENWSANNLPIILGYLNFTESLCLKLALNTPVIDLEFDNHSELPVETIDLIEHLRYQNKIDCYKNCNIGVIPQESKKTGFEYIKKFYAEQYNNPWTFELKFRYPMYSNNPNKKTNFQIAKNVQDYLIQNSNKLFRDLPGHEIS